MKLLITVGLLLKSIASFASPVCETYIEFEGNCLSSSTSEHIVEAISDRGYVVSSYNDQAPFILKIRIDNEGIEVGCKGTATLQNKDEVIVTAQANNRLTGAALSLITFGYSSILPPTGRSVANKILKRLPDCNAL